MYVKAFASRFCKPGFPKPISPQSVVVVARVQVRLHLQEAAVEGLRLVTERDDLCLALAGNEDILYSLTGNMTVLATESMIWLSLLLFM